MLLESFGDGNGPSQNIAFVDCIRRACDDGILILNLSQCSQATIHQTVYETGAVMEQAGVISGCDLTLEAALAKLMHLFTKRLQVDEVKRLMQQSLVGELTAPKN